MRLLLKVLLLVIATLLSAGTASAAAPRLASVAIPDGSVIVGGDGASRVVFVPRSSSSVTTATILDLDTGASSTLDPPLPYRCEIAAGPGGLVSTCLPGPMPRVFTRDFDAPAWTEVPADRSELLELDGITPLAMGRHWVLLEYSNIYRARDQLLLRRDGTDAMTSGDPRLGAGRIPSPDATSGVRSLCAPLRRTEQPDFDDLWMPRWIPFQYAKPWALVGPAVPIHDEDVPALRLRHCGSSKPVTLCRGSRCNSPTLSTRLATWSKDDAAYVRDLKTKRTTTIRVPDQRATLQLVGSHVLVALFGTDPVTATVTYRLLRR